MVLLERCWVGSAGGTNPSAAVVYKRGFATNKTRYHLDQYKPIFVLIKAAQLAGLRLGLGERMLLAVV